MVTSKFQVLSLESKELLCCRVHAKGGILALRAHCALLLDYVPPEEPLGTPLGNALRIR